MPVGDEQSDLNAAMQAAAADRAALLVPQMDLLGDLHADELGFLPNTQSEVVRKRRAAGRPAGARNRRSEDVAKFVIEQLGDPLVQLAALATMPVAELAASVGCSVAEALAEKRLAAIAVLPYLHRRMPQAVEVNGAAFVYLTIRDGVATPLNPSNEIVGIVENQDVSEAPHDAV